MKKIIAIDVMGGEQSPTVAIAAVYQFVNENPDFTIHMYGAKDILQNHLDLKNPQVKGFITTEIITMDDDAMAFRTKLNSSLVFALKNVKHQKASAILSAANTGVYLAASFFILKPLLPKLRPALAGLFPTMSDKYKVVLDIGANNENTPKHLEHFAIMGSFYASILNDVKSPTVGLLANGSEENKGSPITKVAFTLLKNNKIINFKGNIEPKFIFNNDVDVLVCDGFTGNILLKACEGTAKGISTILKTEIKKSLFFKIGALLIKPVFAKLKVKVSVDTAGGAVMLGLNGIVVKSHGDSGQKAYYNSLQLIKKLINADIINKMKKGLS